MLARPPGADPVAARAWYLAYNRRCNAHRFHELEEFVAHDVEVNGEPAGLAEYSRGLDAVVAAFPDYHWGVHHVLVDGDWLAVHLFDRGTHAGPFRGAPGTGRVVRTQEFAHYRIADGLIGEVWVTADGRALGDR